MSQQSLLEGFALMPAESEATPRPRTPLSQSSQPRTPSQQQQQSHDHDTIATPPGTRLQRIIRLYHGWRLWTATRDYKYLVLYNDGRVLNCTTREDEGDDQFWARPSDDAIGGSSGTTE
jgi:hypothetical protein